MVKNVVSWNDLAVGKDWIENRVFVFQSNQLLCFFWTADEITWIWNDFEHNSLSRKKISNVWWSASHSTDSKSNVALGQKQFIVDDIWDLGFWLGLPTRLEV